jgi:hypothetical protein
VVPGGGAGRDESSALSSGRVRSHELTLGRSFGVTFDHGEDFFTALTEF